MVNFEFGSRATGKTQNVSEEEDTQPGKIYRMNFRISSIFPTDQVERVIIGMMGVKKEFPQANITYLRINDDLITLEFYDHPVIPIALIVVAIIAAIVVIGLTVIQRTVEIVAEAVGDLPPTVQSFLAVGVAVAVGGVGISLAASQFRRK